MSNSFVIDDETDLAELIGIQILMAGHNVTVCSDGAKAINMLRNNSLDLVVVNLCIPKKRIGNCAILF